jgi:hypothetical protein
MEPARAPEKITAVKSPHQLIRGGYFVAENVFILGCIVPDVSGHRKRHDDDR